MNKYELYYDNTDQLITVGDRVLITKKTLFFKKHEKGTVDWLPNLSKPPIREKNDYGISIKLDDGSSIWLGIIDGKISNLISLKKL